MILAVYKCDREGCDEETEPIHLDDDAPPFVCVDEPCPAHGMHVYHYCSLECALHGLASHLDHVEEMEAQHEED